MLLPTLLYGNIVGMRIMVVTKTIPIERILPVLAEQKITLIGESRWQEAKDKLPQLPAGIEKHFIGHLQTNKVKEVVVAFDVIETVDSVKLAVAIDEAAKKLGKIMPIFAQVNVSNDSAKHGFLPKELSMVIEQLKHFEHLELTGLMTVTAKQSREQTRRDFKIMKQLQSQFGLLELSMGMSDDWQIAVEEGATIVRLGSALFGERFSARIYSQ